MTFSADIAAPSPRDTVSEAVTTPPEASAWRVAWWMWLLAGVLFLAYSAVSLRMHARLLSNSYDLGVFEQIMRSYAGGQLPVAELLGPDYPALADHFHPILVLLAPFYWLWPSAETLLVAQAVLIAVSGLPLMAWARRGLGDMAAVAIGVCYGISWGIASAIGFDFHEVAFAAPLLACSLAALGCGRLHAAAYWALPLLLVKEDLGLTVAAVGVVVAIRGNRKLGVTTACIGLITIAVVLLVVLPAFNPAGAYGRWYMLEGTGGGSGPMDLLNRGTLGLIIPEVKVITLIVLLAPTLFLALRSPLLWIALPTILWRFSTNYAPHWETDYHYSLVLMPIVFAAFIEALIRRRSRASSVRRYLLGSAAVSLILLPHYPLWQLFQPATWHTEPRVAAAHRFMKKIPDDATVHASTYLVPHLTNRTRVSLYGWHTSRPNPEWIMVDTWVAPARRWPLSAVTERIMLDQAIKKHGYRMVAEESGFVLLNR
ncbi:DUF2079 domain-containing protein [Streptomyces sp. NPDC006283]|uniref:DUF2079 domain-containing protein n=1 Tax=Streptomyces sp. NPDC006283 TaxID=3156741 RepID=UPI0033B30E3F